MRGCSDVAMANSDMGWDMCVCVKVFNRVVGASKRGVLVIKPESDCEPGHNPVGSEETDSEI